MAGTALTVVEQAKLENHEYVIESGLKSFVDVGRALMAIRDERLYRTTHGTFEEYCQERWSIERRHAYRLIDGAAAVENVSRGTQIDPPENERHVRPLTRLPEAEQAEAWQEAVETAPAGKVTAAHVEQVVASRLQQDDDLGDDQEDDEPTDSLGQAIPKKALPAFASADLLLEAIAACNALRKAVNEYADSTGGKFFDVKKHLPSLRDMKRALEESKVYAVCHKCSGRGCLLCRSTGALPESMLEGSKA